MVFKSKVDSWIAVVLWGSVAVCIVPFIDEPKVMTLLLAVGYTALIAYLWFSTKYIIDGDVLVVKNGFKPTKVPIQEIESLKHTNNPLSSPALSMDRMEVVYRPGKQMVLISPKDRERFIAILLEKNSHIHVDPKLIL